MKCQPATMKKKRHLQMLVGLPKSCQRLTVGVLTSLRIRWPWFCSPRWKTCPCLPTISFNALISSCKGRQWQRALKMFNAMWLGCSKSVVCWCNDLNHVRHWQIYTLAKGLAIQTVWWFQTCERNRNKKLEMGSSYPLSVDPHHFRWSVWECPNPLFR